MKETSIKISFLCLSYNHEKFICEALDSMLMQELGCKYEIIIGDDASTDKTVELITNYQQRNPGIIKPIFNKKNIGLIKNFINSIKECKGEYIAYLEGDDYWTDPNKIGEQIELLKKNEECSFSFHNVNLVEENKKIIRPYSRGRLIENRETGVIQDLTIVGAPVFIVHSSSLLFKRMYLNMEYFEQLGEISTPDFPLVVLLCDRGHGYYFNKIMSAYRQHDKSISTARKSNHRQLKNEILNTRRKIDVFFKGKFKKELKLSLKGQSIGFIEYNLLNASRKKNILQFIIYSIQLVLCHYNSQYSLRDTLWLIKSYWCNFKG